MRKLILTSIFLIGTAYGMGHHMTKAQQTMQQMQVPPEPQYHQFSVVQPQSSGINELPNQLVDMIMGQGIVGAMLIILGLWFYRTENQARQDRIKLTDKLEDLVRESLDKTDWIEVKTAIGQLDTRMQNVEREVESLKEYVIAGRIGGRNG